MEQVIQHTSSEVEEKIDWTKAWGKKYPVLLNYQKEVDIHPYAENLSALIDRLKARYGYNDLDAFLVLKDILAAVWKNRKDSQL